MNAMVSNIILWENELENQRMSRKAPSYVPDGDQGDEAWRPQESRWSFMAELFRSGLNRRPRRDC